MKKSQKYRNVIDAIAYQEGRANSWKSLLTQRRFWVKSFIYTAPFALVSGLFVSLLNVDDYLYDNPNELKEIELNQIAYRDSLLDMSNPWNRVNIDDPASFLMALFVGANAEILKNLKMVISKLEKDKLLFLTDILKMVELSDAQRNRFVTLISTLLESDKGLEKLPVLVEILEKLEEADKERQQLEKAEALEQQLVKAVDSLEPGEEGVPEGEIDFSLVDLLTTDKPEALNFLLDTMLSLSPDSYQQLLELMGILGGSRTEKLLAILEDLSRTEMRQLIAILSSINPNTVRAAVDRLDEIPLSFVGQVIQLASDLSPNQIEQLFSITTVFSSTDFRQFVDLHQTMTTSNIATAFEIYTSISSSQAQSLALSILDNYRGNKSDLNLILGALDDFPRPIVIDFVNNFKNLDRKTLNDLPFIFRKLNGTVDRRRFIEEARHLSLSNRQRAIEIFRRINSDSISQTLFLSTNLNDDVNKTQLFEQFYRVFSFDSSKANSERRVTLGYRAPTSVHNSDSVEVLEDFVGQLYDINDNDLNAELLEISDDLSDLSLYRGAEVVSDIDINASVSSKAFGGSSLSKPNQKAISLKASRRNTRVHRLINIQSQLTRAERSTAIDTLHDIDSRDHRKAAIDLGFYADTSLLKESVAYTEQLRFRLGDEEGLEANKRMLVVASRVNDDSLNDFNSIRGAGEEYFSNVNAARQAGLDALKNERESRVSKVLKQTTKVRDPFGYVRTFESGANIIRIVGLYKRLDREEPKISPTHRTRAAELADALSSSEGVILGASGIQGVSREVSQETKLRRIDEYLVLDYDNLWEKKIQAITDRPILVTHREEHQTGTPAPEIISRDPRGKPKVKVTLLKPKQKTGL